MLMSSLKGSSPGCFGCKAWAHLRPSGGALKGSILPQPGQAIEAAFASPVALALVCEMRPPRSIPRPLPRVSRPLAVAEKGKTEEREDDAKGDPAGGAEHAGGEDPAQGASLWQCLLWLAPSHRGADRAA